MPISLPEAEDEHEQKPEAKGGQDKKQGLELENHNELYAYLVDARLGLFDL